MRVILLLLCIAAALFSGCEGLTPPPPEVQQEPVGPQSKQEVLMEIRPAISPLRNTLAPDVPGLSDADRDQVLAALRNAVVNYGNLEFGAEALRELGYEVMEIAQHAASQNRHRLVLACIDAIELLSMESHLLKRLGERADVILDRPAVRVRGFLDDHEKGDTYVFMELVNRRTGEVDRVDGRIGDEFHNLRLVRIIGRNRGVVLEYLRMPGLFFEVEAFRG